MFCISQAVLGFVKVLVSCLEARDLQRLLPDVLKEVLPWSSVSRNHFRSKVHKFCTKFLFATPGTLFWAFGGEEN